MLFVYNVPADAVVVAVPKAPLACCPPNEKGVAILNFCLKNGRRPQSSYFPFRCVLDALVRIVVSAEKLYSTFHFSNYAWYLINIYSKVN